MMSMTLRLSDDYVSVKNSYPLIEIAALVTFILSSGVYKLSYLFTYLFTFDHFVLSILFNMIDHGTDA